MNLRYTRPGIWAKAAEETLSQVSFLLAVFRGEYRPAPHPIKMRIIKRYFPQSSSVTFVETGTLVGDTVHALKDVCDRVISIEIDPRLHQIARKRLEGCAHVELRVGDIATELPEILQHLSSRAVFWLDAHYSGGITGRGAVDDPILLSLAHLKSHSVRSHVLLIDDARCFDSQGARPSLAEVLDAIRSINEAYRILVHNDIIIATTDCQ